MDDYFILAGLAAAGLSCLMAELLRMRFDNPSVESREKIVRSKILPSLD